MRIRQFLESATITDRVLVTEGWVRREVRSRTRLVFSVLPISIILTAILSLATFTPPTARFANGDSNAQRDVPPQDILRDQMPTPESETKGVSHPPTNVVGTSLSAFTTDDVPVTMRVWSPNDVSAEAAKITPIITATSGAAHGILSTNSDGTITYFPFKQFVPAGTKTVDVFSYTARAGSLSYVGSITVIVTETEKTPVVARYTEFTVQKNSADNVLQLPATDENNVPLTYSILTPPTFGFYSIDNTTGMVTYTPNYSYVGNDTLTFMASDGHLESGVGKVQISITE